MAPAGDERFVLDQERHQANLPIVDMHDFGRFGKIAREVGDCFGEKNKSRGVVGIIAAGFAIERGTVVIFGMIDEEDFEIRGGGA